MKFTVVTLFPEMIHAFLREGLVGHAAKAADKLKVATVNPRQYTADVHQSVDDRAFGGGDGMVMKVEPLAKAVADLRGQGPVKVVVLSPQGRPWNQAEAEAWAAQDGHFALVCGRYAGIDQRFVELFADDEVSLGDFILNGGEVAACAIIESVARLLPGVLGNAASARQDSFTDGLLECPQFTRPREVFDLPVPSPLLSGHHAEIAEFQAAVALVRTALLRPDLRYSDKGLARAVERVGRLSDPELRALGVSRTELKTLLEDANGDN